MSSYGQELRERQDGGQRCLGQVAEGFKGSEEGGSDLGQRLAEMPRGTPARKELSEAKGRAGKEVS